MFDRHFFATRRAALGLSVEALADEMHIAASTIRRWENGETSPSFRMLVLASRHLGTPVRSLISEEHIEERSYAVTTLPPHRNAVPAARAEEL